MSPGYEKPQTPKAIYVPDALFLFRLFIGQLDDLTATVRAALTACLVRHCRFSTLGTVGDGRMIDPVVIGAAHVATGFGFLFFLNSHC